MCFWRRMVGSARVFVRIVWYGRSRELMPCRRVIGGDRACCGHPLTLTSPRTQPACVPPRGPTPHQCLGVLRYGKSRLADMASLRCKDAIDVTVCSLSWSSSQPLYTRGRVGRRWHVSTVASTTFIQQIKYTWDVYAPMTYH